MSLAGSLLVTRIVLDHWPVARAAEAQGVSRTTATSGCEIACTSSGRVSRGERCGRELRSSSPGQPSARYRRARPACIAHVPDESARSASQTLLDAAVWFASHGVRIERVLTDNAWAYTRAAYASAIEAIGARHKRVRPHRPQTNGKAERFIKTLLGEWAYGRPYRSNRERLERLPGWVREYNTERTHTSLGGITPMEALVNNLVGITPRASCSRRWMRRL